MAIRSFTFSFILLLTALLCSGMECGDTFELPRQNKESPPSQTEEIDIAGQKRYRILTDHYDITAFRLADGIVAGKRLEHLFNVWELLCAKFIKETESQPVQQRHKVIFYQDKQEYELKLWGIDPSIARTNGYYFTLGKTAYFFSLEAKILFHEGTHQILEEHFFREKTPHFRNNFWIVEGIALFMQTLKVEDNHYRVGDVFADRLFSAKEYRFKHNHNLPIRKLMVMNRADIQSSAEIQQIYSQSATLTHWLMFAEEGRYRKCLFELIRRAYLDTATPETLSELTGLSYEYLDKKYAEFLATIPE